MSAHDEASTGSRNQTDSARARVIALLSAAHRTYLTGLPMSHAATRMETLEQGLQSGWLFPYVWEVRPRLDAWFLADRPSNRGLRIHALQMTEHSSDSVATLLDQLDQSETQPVYAISDLLEGIGVEEQHELFEPRGFSYRALVEMKSEWRSSSDERPSGFDFRPFVPGDRDAFVSLYSRVYREPEGDYWLLHSPDVKSDASVFLGQFLTDQGEWTSRLIARASLVHEIDGHMVGNVILNLSRSGDFHVAGLMVDPDLQRKGIGRSLLRSAFSRLGDSRSKHVSLVVIQGSDAYRLYRAEGFREVPAPRGLRPSYWVRPKNS